MSPLLQQLTIKLPPSLSLRHPHPSIPIHSHSPALIHLFPLSYPHSPTSIHTHSATHTHSLPLPPSPTQHTDPSNGRLRARIGRALVATHEYHRAVEFYESAIREVTKGAPASSSRQGKSQEKENSTSRAKTSEAVSLSHDLARLYLKLGRAESSARVLQKVLHDTHR